MNFFLLLIIPLLVFFYPFHLSAFQDNDVLDMASGAVVLSSTSQYGEKWASLLILDGVTTTGWTGTQ
jgi:hypothetical protein